MLKEDIAVEEKDEELAFPKNIEYATYKKDKFIF
jgi:hypothetical protein